MYLWEVGEGRWEKKNEKEETVKTKRGNYAMREGETRSTGKEKNAERKKPKRERGDSERGGRTERGDSPTPAAAVLSPARDASSGWARAHACARTGPATEPPCQCKRVGPGWG